MIESYALSTTLAAFALQNSFLLIAYVLNSAKLTPEQKYFSRLSSALLSHRRSRSGITYSFG
ncbi:hypothetical protein [Aneurinibacillus danicus]|uniref:Uncharacterized protein n=1 Tax=Aneurinibacillus danicus TaxID=267746 RepID=A0A511VDA5_9BACL|nr:hypothetical protein [Aneurinibacillus danicus]GEN35928.1 hypothetical protein ADA01nite_33880 [Aneurinibacillus danicus]